MENVKTLFRKTETYLINNDLIKHHLEKIIKFYLARSCSHCRHPEVIQYNKYYDALYSEFKNSFVSKAILNPNKFPLPISVELVSFYSKINDASLFNFNDDSGFHGNYLEWIINILLAIFTSDKSNNFNHLDIESSNKTFKTFVSSILFCSYISKELNNYCKDSMKANHYSLTLCLSLIFDLDYKLTCKILNDIDFSIKNERGLLEKFLKMSIQPNYQYNDELNQFEEYLNQLQFDEDKIMKIFDEVNYTLLDMSPLKSIIHCIIVGITKKEGLINNVTIEFNNKLTINSKLDSQLSIQLGDGTDIPIKLKEINGNSEYLLRLEYIRKNNNEKYIKRLHANECLEILKDFNKNSQMEYVEYSIISCLGQYGLQQIDECMKLISNDNRNLSVALSLFFERPALD